METMTIETVCVETPIVNAEAAAAAKEAKKLADKAKREAAKAAKKAEADKAKAEAADKARAAIAEAAAGGKADPVKAAAKKVINAELKAAVDADKDVQTSFTSMKKRLLEHGKGYIYAIGMRYSVAEALTPAQIKPHQLAKERFRSVKQEDGTYIDHELPWTFRKFLIALERMAKQPAAAF